MSISCVFTPPAKLWWIGRSKSKLSDFRTLEHSFVCWPFSGFPLENWAVQMSINYHGKIHTRDHKISPDHGLQNTFWAFFKTVFMDMFMYLRSSGRTFNYFSLILKKKSFLYVKACTSSLAKIIIQYLPPCRGGGGGGGNSAKILVWFLGLRWVVLENNPVNLLEYGRPSFYENFKPIFMFSQLIWFYGQV